MPDLPNLLLFIGAGVLLNLTPGPDVFYIISQSLSGNVVRGYWASMGIALGCCVHVLTGAFGVTALFAALPSAFTVLKWAGAVYLIYMGLGMLRAVAPQTNQLNQAKSIQNESNLAVLRRGFLTNVLNPKVALFFLAFVPQFIPAETAQPWLIFLLLGLLFVANGLLVCALWALAAAWLVKRSSVISRHLHRIEQIAGIAFIAFGIKLALSEMPARHT